MLKAAIPAPLPAIPRAISFLVTLETRRLSAVCSLLLRCYLQSRYKHLTTQYIFIKALTRWGSCSTTHTMAPSAQLKESKRFRKIEKSGSLASKREVVGELAIRSHQAFRKWLRRIQWQARTLQIWHKHFFGGLELLRWCCPRCLALQEKKKSQCLLSQLYFFWNYYFIMHNQPYSSFPSLWAAHPGSPSFAQLQDSCFQMLSNTTDEFGASSQDHCVPVNLLRHFHRHNRTAHTALWPASMETMWIIML